MSQTLYISDTGDPQVLETTRQGALLRVIDLTGIDPEAAAGIVYAPASGDRQIMHLYIVDRGVDNDSVPTENDGKMYELSVGNDPVPNQPPQVDAGGDQIVMLAGNAILEGSVIDDLQPDPPAAVTVLWSSVSGPGTVTFGDATALSTTASFSIDGTYVLRMTADDSALNSSDELSVEVLGAGVGVLDVRVAASFDDAEERSATGFMLLTSSDLELGVDGEPQVVGMRFNGVDIPQGFTVLNASIQFTADEGDDDATSFSIRAEDVADAAAFGWSTGNLSVRPTTTTSVSWVAPPWNVVGDEGFAQQTPDITAVLQEVINRPDWVSGNSIAVFMSGTGTRTAESYNGDSDAAPLLHIQYDVNPPPNKAPWVSAGADQQLQLPDDATLDGSVSDDDLASVTTTWTKSSGPGVVTFGDPAAIDTTAGFSLPGVYVLRVTADDGEFTAFDELTVTVAPVNDPPVVGAGPDLTITQPGSAVLDAAVSDNDLGTVTTTWSQVSGPGVTTFADASAVDTTASFSLVGTYGLRFTADDGQFSVFDDVSVSVEVNDPPTVVAGPDETIQLPAVATLDGTVSDDDPATLTTAWTKTLGPGTVSFGDGSATDTSATFSAAGVYLLRLTASDGQFDPFDQVVITVDPANESPVVAAGLDQTITQPAAVVLDGTVTDDMPLAVTTSWTAVSGPGVVTFSAPGAVDTTATFSAVGAYVLRLTADDGEFAPFDELNVTVEVNDPPLSSAGPDQAIQLPAVASLDGTVSDDDLATVTTTWSQVSGPGITTFIDAGAVDTTASFSLDGVYVLRLAADDAEFLVFDEVTISVTPANTAPVVVAGLDQTITQPAAIVLDGTVSDDDLLAVTTVWSQVSGPGLTTFTDAGAVDTTARFDTIGVYVLRLSADDGEFVVFDERVVTVEVNDPPDVAAGLDQSIQLPAGATLDGMVSDDDPLTLTTTWTQVSGPGLTTFGDASAVATTASFSLDGVYVLRLTGSDGEFAPFDELTITVAPANTAPVVVAGVDQTSTQPAAVLLDGTVTDDDLLVVTTTWTQVSGPGVATFADASAVDTTASFDLVGAYVLRLTADDGQFVVLDELTVTVEVNDAPVVAAGVDQTIQLPAEATLDATVTDDDLATVTTVWTKVLGPGTASFADAAAVDTSVSFTAPGVYILRLTADDGEFTALGQIIITVDPANTAPVVAVGLDQSITQPAAALLDGTLNDDDPLVVTLTWSQVSGPGVATFADASAVDTTATFDVLGAYVLRLTADDGEFVVFDELTITVEVNDPPTASAGPDQVIQLPAGATLDGTVTDDDLATVTTTWAQLSGPGVTTFVDASALDTSASFDLDGIYVLRLSVTDGEFPVFDDVSITVAAANTAPVVGAGLDQTVTQPAAAALDGSVSDDDLLAVTLTWGQVSGPGTTSFADASAADTTATFDALGVYVLSLTADDGEFAPFDELTVTVEANDPPLVDAGPDQALQLPLPATLDGTVSDDDPATLTTTWSQLSGPGVTTFADAGAVDTTASFDLDGIYVLRLSVTDGEFPVSDEVTVTVAPPNGEPVVAAGPDQTITQPAAAVLDGTVIDDGSKPVTTSWTQVSGPGATTFVDAFAIDTSASFSAVGVYVLRLSADDGEFQQFDELTITVEVNDPPDVSAGLDQAIQLPQGATLDGTLSDDDLATVTTTWSQVSGPGSTSFAAASAVDTTASFDMDGVYVLRLTADDAEFVVFDELTVTVSPINTAPLVTAGLDQALTQPAAAVLDGTITDDDLLEVSVSWAQVSGPGLATFADAGAVDTTATFDLPGVYVLRLTADDGEFVVSDVLTVTVEVNDPPVVAGGPDQTIQLPAVASLDGTVSDDDPATVTTIWSQLSGPGVTTFADASAVDTTASFDLDGVYVLRLTASDGEFAPFSDVTISVDPINSAPVVSAGFDVAITQPGDVVLDGTVSDDDLLAVSLTWSQVSGPGLATFGNASAEDTTAGFDQVGVYVLRLTADDGEFASFDEVQVTVEANDPPTVAAGPDRSIQLPAVAALDGTVTDDDPATVTTTWAQVSGPGITTFDDASSVDTTASFDLDGVYVLRLTADDAEFVVLDELTVSVDPANTTPLVSAGLDQAITQPADVVLDGTVTDDDLLAVSLTWNQVSGPGLATFADSSAEDTTAGFDLIGVYVLRLTADDGEFTPFDEVTITVEVNDPPTVSAGLDRLIQLPEGVTLDGTVDDDDLATVSTTWSQVSGPGVTTFADASSVDTTASFDLDGVYVLRLTADDAEFVVLDELTVSVDPANTTPVVSAGLDQAITQPGPAVLDGSVTDDDLLAVTSTWTQVSGPGLASFADAGAVDTTVSFDTLGAYVLRLTADDGEFAPFDDLTITVEVNDPPVVGAGLDQTIQLPSGAALDGTLADDDLATVTTTWSQVSGPGVTTFADASAVDTTASFDLDGTYVLRLTADDGEFVAADELNVTVEPPNEPPLVGAGADQAVQLRAGVALDGTVTDDDLLEVTTTWSQTSGPGTASFGDASAVDTTASFDLDGVYVLRLMADDGEFVPFDELTVTVTAANTAPTVDVGADLIVVVPNDGSLQATVTDDDLAAVTTTWSQVSGPATAVFGDIAALDTTVSFPAVGSYVLRLTADDGEFATTDELTVTVKINDPPTVGAGADKTLTQPAAAALDGTLADDDMLAVTSTWTQVSGPGTASFADGSAAATTATFSAVGTYVLRLTADDGEFQVFDEVSITVEVNDPPTVSAGADQALQLPAVAPLDGTLNDDDPVTLTSTWSQVSGPGLTTFADAGAVDTLASFDLDGVYVLRLTGNDGEFMVFDELTVTVSPANTPPVVGAGVDQAIQLPAGAVLDGSLADDDPAAVTTLWSQLSGPGLATFADSAAVSTTASFDLDGVYVLRLAADDGEFAVFDELTVTVAPANTPPVVAAGLDQTLTHPAPALLDGSLTDDDPAAVTTTWSQVSGPGTASFADGSAVGTSASFSTPGIYVLRLTADDGEFAVFDEVTITVEVNDPPVVGAGADQALQLPANAVLDGTLTDDDLATVTTSWSQVSGPGTTTFVDASAVDTTASFDLDGVYVLRLSANDGEFAVIDELTIAVSPANTPPVVGAGVDQALQLPADATLVGSLTDDDPAAVTTTWSQVSGPGSATFVAPGALSTLATFSLDGVYVLRLSADDGEFVVFDELTIAVSPANTMPTVFAGVDRQVQLPSAVTLDGSVDDDDLNAVSTIWSQVSGPGAAVFGDVNLTDTTVSFPVDGSYVLRLTADDGEFAPFDEVTVVVDPANQPPIVVAGVDQTLTQPASAVLDGTVADDDLLAVTTTWSQLSGPGLTTFLDPSVTATTASFSIEGTYVLRLTADDGEFAVFDELTVIVEVNDPPVVAAGLDQSIQLPAVATLDGTLTDDDLATVTTTWSQVGGPGTATFADAAAVDTTAGFDLDGVYVLRLTADDGEFAVLDELTVTVSAANTPPVVAAGPDVTLTWPASAVLDGTLSDDDLLAVTTIWSQVSGPGTATFADAGAVDTTASFSLVGPYVLRLTADDGEFAPFDELTVIVEVNDPPIVAAGLDVAIQLPSGATLDGTVTDDDLPTVTTTWSQVSGPGTATIADAGAVDTTASFDLDGVYVLRLTADDGEFAVLDELTLTVFPANTPPVVSAGPDATLTWPASASLDGTLTDDDLLAVTTTWSQLSGPGTTTFADAGAVDTTASFSLVGTYVLRLTADDGQFVSFDEVMVSVEVNDPPLVSAGLDMPVQLRADATLDGTVTDDDPATVTSLWTQVSGPGTATIAAATLVDTTASFDLDGVYVLRLTATDGEFVVLDELTVTVSPANQPPAVGAGADLTLTQPAQALLDGTVADDDLLAVTTTWSQLSGPGTTTFADAAAVDTLASFSQVGTYVLRLTADDGEFVINDECSVVVEVNDPPLVAVGLDLSIQLPTDAALDATVSDDDPSTLTTLWSQVSGPGTASFGDAALVDTTASFDLDGVYVLRLTANDGEFAVLDELTVTVAPPNTPPVVGVGLDLSIQLPADATLDGTLTDDDPADVTTLWTQMSGPGTATFADAAAVDTLASFDLDGMYVLRLTADDGEFVVFDELLVTVSPVNTPPLVGAGLDQAIQLPADATLDGTLTDDDLLAVTTLWSQLSGPGAATFADAGAVDTTASFDLDGVYVLRLAADDGEFVVFDELTITVSPVNVPPVVGAGPDQAIELPGDATLDGTLTDDDLLAVTTLWSQLSGPGTTTFADAGALDTTAGFDLDGVYVLRLTADDGEFVVFDELTVTVTIPNTPPIVTAGLDRSVKLGDAAVLEGTVVDDDLPSVTTSWSQLSGPGVVAFIDPSMVDTTASFSAEGSYILRLTAIDPEFVAFDEVSITVFVSNTPPIVSAGADTSVQLPAGTALFGSVTDDGLSAVTLSWTRVSGPGSVFFGDTTLAETQVMFNTPGEQVLRLTADDGESVVFDELSITVLPHNQPPTISAGADVAVVLPASAALDGTVLDDSPDSVSVTWSQLSGPGSVAFGDLHAVDTTASFSVAGIYSLRLTGFDGQYLRSDEVTVFATTGSNLAPTVFAGKDEVVTLPGTASLDGSVQDDLIGSVTTLWSRVSGPGGVVFGDPSAVDTTASFPAAGTYVLRLTAGDGEFSVSDELTVQVLQPGVFVPSAGRVGGTRAGALNKSGGKPTTAPATSGGQASYRMPFADIEVPQGARILSAHVELPVTTSFSPCMLSISALDAGDLTPAHSASLGGLPRSRADVPWMPLPFSSGPATPDITPVIQELVDRHDWSSGNALLITISGTHDWSRAGSTSQGLEAPMLHIEFD